MKTLKFRKFKAFSIMLVVIVLSTLGCQKDNEMVTKPEVLAIKDSSQVYVFEGKEYTVKMVQEGNDYVPVENDTTKMLGEAMEQPTSSIYVDKINNKLYLFNTSDEADIFVASIKKEKKAKATGSDIDDYIYHVSMVLFYYDYFNIESIIYDGDTYLAGSITPARYNNFEFDYYDLSLKGCNDAISSLEIHGAIKDTYEIGCWVTLCENNYYGGKRLYLFASPGQNLFIDLMDYKFAFRKTWSDKTSSLYINI